MPDRPPTPLPTVVLRHTSPDGVHLDWMIERPGSGDLAGLDTRSLATWRLDADREPGDWRVSDTFDAARIGDHRRAYLVFQGELTGDRGSVQRIDAGEATALRWEATTIELDVRMGGFAGRVRLSEAEPGGSRWTVRVLE